MNTDAVKTISQKGTFDALTIYFVIFKTNVYYLCVKTYVLEHEVSDLQSELFQLGLLETIRKL